ncbi:hypothetical protein IV203_008432 [Nitzschia inconspicua]|uniref:Uncharacterized protein n=1 Tax=Nitzschia inconspicua TaxID=303405 RepID=A0A9K3KYI4_9STRA|nr:hypothetical protein IV203_008432 [Nitzschia inconspicua]
MAMMSSLDEKIEKLINENKEVKYQLSISQSEMATLREETQSIGKKMSVFQTPPTYLPMKRSCSTLPAAVDNGDDEESADEIVLAPFNNPTTAQRRPHDVVRQLAPSFNAVPAEKTKSNMSSVSFKDLLYDLKDILDLEDVGKTPIPKDTVTENWKLTNCLQLLQIAVTQSTEAKEAKEELKQLKHGMVRGDGLRLAAKLERRALDMLFVLKGDDPTTEWRKKGKKPTG